MGERGNPGIEGVNGEKVGSGLFFNIFASNSHVPLKPKDSTTIF